MINYRKIDKDLIEKDFNCTFSILGKYCRHKQLEDIGLEDLYYRSQIIKLCEKKIEYNHAKNNVYKYNYLLYELEEMKDDESRAKFVASIEDREMKLALLRYIQKRENRDLIINSFDKKVDKEIESIDKLIQRMIREYFEDKLGNKLTDDKRERLELVLRGSDVSYGDASNKIKGRELEGFADCFERDITISCEIKGKIKKIIGDLAHEYGHLFSMFNVAFTNEKPKVDCEEGMADIFSDVVINHFLQKYGRIELDGKIVIEDYPYIGPSCYKERSNLFPRTMLAGLENSGKDAEAISEYFLGNKTDFLKMIFGERALVPGKGSVYNYSVLNNTDFFIYDENQERLYHLPLLDYSRISRESIYYHRENDILPLFIIQNKVKDKANVLWGFNNDIGFNNNIGNVAELFFDGQSFFEVNDEKFQEFLDLLKDASIHYKDRSLQFCRYMDACVDGLEDDTVKENSFEIMGKMSLLAEMMPKTRFKNEWIRVLKIAIDSEREKLRKEQMTEEKISEELQVLKKYISSFSKKKNADTVVLDALREFESECEMKITELENHRVALVDKETINTFAQENGVALIKDSAIIVTDKLVLPKDKGIDEEAVEGRKEE